MGNLQFILDTLQTKHIGDRDALELLVLSAISAHPDFDVKLHVALIGDSDVGKTHATNTVLGIVPKENQYETKKVSPKVLYYEVSKGYSFKNKIIFLDDVTERDAEILKDIANTSDETPSFSTLINQEVKKLILDCAPVVWTTKVELIGDEQGQADRRFYTVEVKGSTETLEHTKKLLCGNIKPQDSTEWKKVKDIFKKIMQRQGKVIVPHFSITGISNSGMRFLIAIIRSLAKIEGRTEANDEDIKEGLRLFKSNSTQQLKLKESSRIILDNMPSGVPMECDIENPDNSEYTVQKIFEKVKDKKIGMPTVRKDLVILCKTGHVSYINGNCNRKHYYIP